MALKKSSYTDARGVDYVDSYWTVNQVNIMKGNGMATILWLGFKDHAACLAGKQSIGERQTVISGQNFIDAVTAETAKLQSIFDIVHAYALSVQDVQTGIDTTDPKNPVPVMECFFADATIV